MGNCVKKPLALSHKGITSLGLVFLATKAPVTIKAVNDFGIGLSVMQETGNVFQISLLPCPKDFHFYDQSAAIIVPGLQVTS